MARSRPISASTVQMLIAAGVGLPVLVAAIAAYRWSRQVAVPPVVVSEERRLPPSVPYAFQASLSDHTDVESNAYHGKIKIISDIPCVRQPATWCTDQIRLPRETEVIGVLLGEHAYAFVINAMRLPVGAIISLTIDRNPVVITYCDPTNETRVFTKADREDLIPLHVGGMDVENGMVVMLNGTRYSQMSRSLPLDDYPHEIVSLDEWSQRHPRSRLYLGPCYPPAALMNQLRSSLP